MRTPRSSGLVVIALVTFITSFDAVSAVGAERGAVSPALAWAIPLALDDARAEGRLQDGALVLMTGMGAGLTWGSALIEWTNGRSR